MFALCGLFRLIFSLSQRRVKQSKNCFAENRLYTIEKIQYFDSFSNCLIAVNFDDNTSMKKIPYKNGAASNRNCKKCNKSTPRQTP